jgi:hypothetical protein
MVTHYLDVTITVEIIVLLIPLIMVYLMILLQFVLSYRLYLVLEFHAGEARTAAGCFTWYSLFGE